MSKTLEEIKMQYAKERSRNGWPLIMIQDTFNCKQMDEVAERYAKSQTQELTDWKESIMKVHSELDLQGIGKVLGLPLGSSIAPQVLPKVKELLDQNRELVDMLKEWAYEFGYGVDKYTPQELVEITEKLLTKYQKS